MPERAEELKLTPREAARVESDLDGEPKVIPELAEFIRNHDD